MKYRAQFSKGWQGTWVCDAINDIRAWETVKDFINTHTQTVVVDISEIWELDETGNAVRKLNDYKAYFTPYKVNYANGECILNIYREKDDVLVWNEAKKVIKKEYNSEVSWIEELDKINQNTIRRLGGYKECKKIKDKVRKQIVKNENLEDEEVNEEKAVYKAYFSDGECSGPYIADISENDTIALNMANFKLKQYAEYNGIDVNEIKVTKVEELNENKLFEVNLIRKREKKNRILSIRECS
ncbi:MAG: hypothetical protein LBU18_04835 [Treponema sp.]|jgi:hypothetical protein|nr:hypothetical protein [Treponema sp.]